MNSILPVRRVRVLRLVVITLISFAGAFSLLYLGASARRATLSSVEQQPLAPNAPSITVATLTDNTAAATKVTPGSTINYTAVITNGAAPGAGNDATNVIFSNPLDANTTLVPNSVNTTPVAVNESYPVYGNVNMSVPDGVTDLLANDIDPDNGNNSGLTLTTTGLISSVNCAACNNVNISADGSFTYDPPVGFIGPDTFTYTVRDNGADGVGGNADDKTAQGTVTLNITGMIWFVNNAAAACTTLANQCGKLSKPFSSLDSFRAVNGGGGVSPAASQDIFIYQSATANTLTAALALLASQRLIGQDSAPNATAINNAALFNISLPTGSATLPSTDTAGTTASITGFGLSAATGNTIRGLTINNTGVNTKLAGTSFGTLTLGDITLSGTGKALDLTTGTLATHASAINQFASIASTSSGTQGINLSGVAGTLTSTNGTTISGSTTQGILIGTSTANMSFGNTSVTPGTDGISLQNNSAGTRSFGTLTVTNGSGKSFVHAVGGGTTTVAGLATLTNPGSSCIDIQDSTTAITFANVNCTLSAATGVFMDDNTGAVTFADLDIAPDNNVRGLQATAGNTGAITTTSGTIATASQPAIDIVGTDAATRTPLNMQLTSVSANGGVNGIVLTNTSSSGSPGGFRIGGTGTTVGSGGTIQNMTTRGANIITATDIVLKNMNFTSANNSVDGGGAGACDDTTNAGCNAAIYLSGTTGLATLDNLDITGTMVENGITALNVANFKFDNGLIDGAGNEVHENGIKARNLSGTATVNNSEIRFSETDSFYVNNTSTSVSLTVSGSTFRDTQTVSSGGAVNPNGEGGLFFNSFGSATSTINVLNNSFLRIRTQSIQVFSQDTSTINLDIVGNTIDAQADIGTGIDINADDNATLNFNITSNPQIQSRGGAAVNITSFLNGHIEGRVNNNPDIEVLGSAGIPIKITPQETSHAIVLVDNNIVSNINGTEDTMIDVQARFQTARVDATITRNSVTGEPTGVAGINLISGSSTGGEANITCGDIGGTSLGNNVTNALGNTLRAFRVRNSDLSNTNRIYLEGFTADTATTWGNRGNTPNVPAEVAVSLTGSAVAPLAPPGGICEAVDTPTDFPIPPPSGDGEAGAKNSSLRGWSFLGTAYSSPLELLASIEPFVNRSGGAQSVSPAASVKAQSTAKAIESTDDNQTSVTTFVRSALNSLHNFVATVDLLITPTVHAQNSSDPNAPQAGETVTVNGGGPGFTLAAGKSITVTFSATVNTTALTARQASTQSTISGGNFANVLSDDPDVGGAQATITLLDTTLTWTGDTSTDWNVAANWDRPGPVESSYAPGVSNPAVNDVLIPNVGAQPSVTATDIGVYSLNISNGRTLTIGPARILTIGGSPGGDLTLDGIISGGNLNLGTGTHSVSGAGSLSSTNSLTILSGSTTTLNGNLQIGQLTVNSGGSLNITNRTLSLNGTGLTVQGGSTFTTTGSTVVFNGSAAQTAAGIAYNNLTINNTAAGAPNALGVTLTGNATVNGTLALTSNDLNTGGFVLTQPNTTASTGAGDVVGTVTRSGGPFGLISLTFGNPSNIITFTGAGTRPTTMTVVMAKAAPATYAAAVQRNYTISQTGGTGFTATVRLHYLDSELNGNIPETSLGLRRLRTSDSHWVAAPPPPGVPTRDGTANWVEATGVLAADLTTQWTLSTLAPTAANGSITGRIVDGAGNPVEGAVVRLEGTQNRKFITDANGVYRFDGVETNGFYTVTPSRANYTFSPAERSFTQLGESTNAAFGATLASSNLQNPLDTPEYFVRQHYLDFLGREPDEAGFNFWSDQILECGMDQNCISRRRENVSAAYFLSIEFRGTGGLVDGMYRAAYGARPEFSSFMPDMRIVGLGVRVGDDGWEAKLEANKEAFATEFANRPAFHALYDNMDNSLFVDTLIGHTGVSFTSTERDALVSGLGSGTMTRAEVLRSIAENERFVSVKLNETFVMMEYFGYLRRDPDAGGFTFWLSKLNEFNGNFEQAEMVKAFIVSGEYRDRFPR